MGYRTLGLAIAGLLSACAGATDHVQSFPPNTRVHEAGTLTVELREVHYETQRLTVDVALRNGGSVPIRIGAEGIFLAEADGALEFPPNADPQTALQSAIDIPPNEARSLRVAFDVAGLEPQSHRLRLRQIWAGEAPQPTLSVPVPGLAAAPSTQS